MHVWKKTGEGDKVGVEVTREVNVVRPYHTKPKVAMGVPTCVFMFAELFDVE